MRVRFNVLLLSAVLSMIVVLSGCGKQASKSLSEVRMGSFSSAVDYAPYLVAKNKGWFDEAMAKRGIKVTYTKFESLPPINESFGSNRLDVVFEAEPPAIVGKAAGINLCIVGESCSLVQEILVHTSSNILTAQDLKGKKIAVLAGTSSHYGLLKILGEAGVKQEDVEIVDMVPPDAKNAFETNKVDAWAVWPPWVEQEELSGKGRVLPRGDAQIHSIMAVNGAFAKQNPEVTKELVAVVQKAKDWIAKNPDAAQGIVAKELNVPLAVIKKAWPRHNWAATIDNAVTTDIQAKADFLVNKGFIKKPVRVSSDLVDLSYSK